MSLICHGDSHEDVRCFRQLSMSAYCLFVSADSYQYLAKPRFGLRTSAQSSQYWWNQKALISTFNASAYSDSSSPASSPLIPRSVSFREACVTPYSPSC